MLHCHSFPQHFLYFFSELHGHLSLGLAALFSFTGRFAEAAEARPIC